METFDSDDQTTPAVDLKAAWPSFLESLSADRPNIGTFLSMAYVASASEHALDLRFPARCSFQFAEITRTRNREYITRMLSSFAGGPVDLHITIEKRADNDAPRQSGAPAPRVSPSLRDDMENEPIIKNVLDIFDGEVVN